MSEFEFDKEGYTPDNYAIEEEKEQIIPEKERSVFEEAASTVEKEERPAGEYTYAFKGDSLPSGGTYDPRKTDEEKAPASGVYGNPETYIPYSAGRQQNPYEGTHRPEQNPYGGYGNGASYQNGYNGQSAYGQPHYGAPANGYRPAGAPTPPTSNEPKKEKKKSSVKTSTAILLCAACVLLSFASGILGSALIYGAGGVKLGDYALSEGDTENGAVAGIDKNGAVVLYRSVDTVTEDGGQMTIAEVANTVSDSVVEITTEFVTTDNFFFGQYVSEGAGSGVIISQDGYIITNNHVISDASSGEAASKITVRLRSGEEYEASLIGKDADSDVAILKIKAENLKAAVWGDSEKLVVGQQVVAVGNPLGELGGTVTTGIISASDREVQIDNVVMTLIQIDAAVNPGNSGGGLFNTKGELIGIVNAKSSGSGIEGLGFAIPSNEAQDITTQLLEHGYVRGKVYLGLSFYEANSGYFSSSGDDGILYVYATEEGYNDDVLKSKDIILSIDGEEVSTTAEVKAILKKHKVGDKLTFSILRDRVPMEVEVTCYEAKPIGSSVDFDD
ncbi:MAG: trypsin-like serine protease [Ruminococcaceae bacterium]|nr:trypsin-like serine protease [Oscillospiraceae bacterium]